MVALFQEISFPALSNL